MNKLNAEKDSKYIYTTNRNFLFPQSKLDRVIDKYSGIKFFPEIFNEETSEFEGGYYPDQESYQTDKDGRLLYGEDGKPLREEGFIQKNIKKIPGAPFIKRNIFDPFKDLIVPGSPKTGFTSKPQTPPLGDTPMPVQMASNTQQKNPQTNLTRNEEALLSPTEKVIASRT
jgi:hypothetical protein